MDIGKKLDALVAEKVMGWRVEAAPSLTWYWDGPNHSIDSNDWRPSTNMSDAWMLVEKFKGARSRGGRIWVQVYAEPTAKEYKEIGEIDHGLPEWTCVIGNSRTKNIRVSGESAEHAICLAFLRFVGVDL